MTAGIYAKTRNPIYLAFILIIVGIAVFSTAELAFMWAFGSILVIYWVAKKEEADLERLFGELYLAYKREVPMFVPRFEKLWRV